MEHKHIGPVVLDESAIAQGVEKVAAQLNQKFDHAVVITVVPGGILFTADLVRKLTFDINMDTLSCPHTPGDRNNSSTIAYHQNIDINGKDVILVDDAIESGGTMQRLVEHLKTHYSPKSVSVAILFVKPGRVAIDAPQYYALEMDNDDMLIGFGMPWENKYRNLPYVAKLKS